MGEGKLVIVCSRGFDMWAAYVPVKYGCKPRVTIFAAKKVSHLQSLIAIDAGGGHE